MTDLSPASLRQCRIDLAAAFRWAVRLGLHEGVCNHFSLAVGGDRFLVNPFGLHWSEITASSLLLADYEGHVVEGEGTVEDTAFYIHSRVHKLCPQATCVLHTHMPYATALTLVEGGRLEPVHQTALKFTGRVAYDETYAGLALDGAEGDRIAAGLGNRSIMFMAAHGVLVTAPTVAEAFDDLYYLERACQAQVLARSTGLPLRVLPRETVARTEQQFATGSEAYARLHFDALKRLLDRQEPDYRH
ncbi:MAG: aldolase [Alphaproteobacteria bacterium]